MKARYIPNALSITRILLCIPLAIMEPFSLFYIVLFAATAVTDLFDGKLARRIKGGASELGATLDSVADVALVSILIFRIMPKMEILWWWVNIAFTCVLLLKIFASTTIGFIRFKEVISLHTITFKWLVTALFSYPIIYYIVIIRFNLGGADLFINIYSTVVIISALLIVIEEIFIISMTKRPERNIKSIFGVRAANEAADAAAAAAQAEETETAKT